MQYKPLGNTGLYISEITLGAMTFSYKDDPFGSMIGQVDLKATTKMIDISIEHGVNLIDTANMYSNGQSEELVGKALGDRRKDMLVATKVYFPASPEINAMGTSRLAIMREVELSLKRLNTDWIDLYQVHRFDETTPIEETLRSLDDLVRQGKVRYIGLSNFSAWQIAKAIGISERWGWEKFCSVQAYYSLAGRELEREIIPVARDNGMGILVWSPLAGGFLAGKYTREDEGEGRRKKFDFPPVNKERGFDIIDKLKEIGKAHDASAAQIALAWLNHKSSVTSIIIGATKENQLIDNLKSVEIKLSVEEMTVLDEVSAFKPEYPNWMMPVERGKDPWARHRNNIKE